MGVLFLLLLQGWVKQGSCRNRKRSAMGSMDKALCLQVVQVFADRDLRDPEGPRQFMDQHPPIVLDQPENVLASLVDQHRILLYFFRRCTCHFGPLLRNELKSTKNLNCMRTRSSDFTCIPLVGDFYRISFYYFLLRVIKFCVLESESE